MEILSCKKFSFRRSWCRLWGHIWICLVPLGNITKQIWIFPMTLMKVCQDSCLLWNSPFDRFGGSWPSSQVFVCNWSPERLNFLPWTLKKMASRLLFPLKINFYVHKTLTSRCYDAIYEVFISFPIMIIPFVENSMFWTHLVTFSLDNVLHKLDRLHGKNQVVEILKEKY